MTRTQRVAIGRAQILEDVYRGVFIAEDIQSFSDLHEYVDANKYGGFLEPVDFQPFHKGDLIDHRDWLGEVSAVQQQLHTWIVNGGLADLQEWDEHHALTLSRSR
tara:strand:+ start:138 stop:452 length:315 start_codon:yes stop_codon:yes gene_type:complete